MGDDEFLKELKAVAQEETDLNSLPGDELLDQLAEGTLSEEGFAQLEALAAQDEKVALAMRAFAPLGEAFEEQLTDSLLGMVGAAEPEANPEPSRVLKLESAKPSFIEWLQNLFKFETPVFGQALAGAAALAMVAVFYPGTESPLERYSLEMGQGDAAVRGESQKVASVPTYSSGSQVTLLLRPAQKSDDAFNVRVYMANKSQFSALQVETQISSGGAVKLSGKAGSAFPAGTEPYQIIAVVSRFDDTPDEATIRQAVQTDSPRRGEHWQILSTEIRVK